MSVDVFLDTNVLLYAASGPISEDHKRGKARQIIRSENFGISAQVLQEFYVNAVRKVEVAMRPDQALAWMAGLELFPCVAVDRDLVKLGISNSSRFRISCWDGTIIAAAQILGAGLVYSEDLNDGQLYDSVRVINPFREM